MPQSFRLLTTPILALTLIFSFGLAFGAQAITAENGDNDSTSGSVGEGKDPGIGEGSDGGGDKSKDKSKDKTKDKTKDPGKGDGGSKDDPKDGVPTQCAAGSDVPGC